MYNRDWRNRQDYAYTDSHNRELWAWEFLRRNKDYIKDWNSTLKKSKIRSDKFTKQIHDLLYKSKGSVNLFPGFKTITPENLDPETMRVLLMMYHSKSSPHDIQSLDNPSALKKWGLLCGLRNPNRDDPRDDPDMPLFKHYGYYFDRDTLHILTLSELEDNEVVIKVDLDLPIQQQLEHYKSLLDPLQKELHRIDKTLSKSSKDLKNNWLLYIRLLDAKADKANNHEISAFLFPRIPNEYPGYHGNKKVRYHLKYAQRIVEGEYRSILTAPSTTKHRGKKS